MLPAIEPRLVREVHSRPEISGDRYYAQTDEIQVYTGEINKPGEFSVTLHGNYTPIGPTQPTFTGGVVPNHSL